MKRGTIKIEGMSKGRMSGHRFLRSVVLTLVIVSTFFAFAQQDKRGRKYKAPPETMKVDILVVRATTGKPIPNAAVIFHPVNEKGKTEGAMELKTDLEGKTTLDVIPIGSTVRLQVIANGFQTFGNDYVANADAKELLVLKTMQNGIEILGSLAQFGQFGAQPIAIRREPPRNRRH